MKKIILSAIVAISITGCFSSLESVSSKSGVAVRGVSSIESLCLNGVSYYFYFRAGKAAMSVDINKDTLKPETCK